MSCDVYFFPRLKIYLKDKDFGMKQRLRLQRWMRYRQFQRMTFPKHLPKKCVNSQGQYFKKIDNQMYIYTLKIVLELFDPTLYLSKNGKMKSVKTIYK